MPKPVLLLGCGNLSRGDDALGPLLLEFVEQHGGLAKIELLSEFQLQIEHALDLENRELVLFADASVNCADAFEFTELQAARDSSYTSHALSPAAVMAVYRSINNRPPPACFLLAIKGEAFELGEGLSANGEKHLQQACRFVENLLSNPDPAAWRQLVSRRTGHVETVKELIPSPPGQCR